MEEQKEMSQADQKIKRNVEQINKDIQQSQIFYSPQPRKSLSLMNTTLLKASQQKNKMAYSIKSTSTSTQDIDIRSKVKNPSLQMSITEKVVTEAIFDLNIALRAHNSSLNSQSLVNNNSSFISMNDNDKTKLRKNRIQYQPDGLLVQQYYKNNEIFIPILPIKSKTSPYMLEIKDLIDGQTFYEEQEVFLAYDHITNYYFYLKVYIAEKGSDDAILFALDNANYILQETQDQIIESNIHIKAFCFENIEKNQLNIFFMKQTNYYYSSENSSSSSNDSSSNSEDDGDSIDIKQSASKTTSNIKDNIQKQSSSQRKKKEKHDVKHSCKQDEELQKTVQKYVKIARIYSFLGQPDMAISYYNRIFNNQNITKFNVSEVDALEELMFFLEEMEKETEALKKADRLLEIYEKIGNIEKMKQILFFKGNLSIKIGDFASAEKDYSKLLEHLHLQDGEEMSYLAGITYGKLADVQYIYQNNDKCLELLHEWYKTLIQIYKNQALPDIQELQDDEEEYKQFNKNNNKGSHDSYDNDINKGEVFIQEFEIQGELEIKQMKDNPYNKRDQQLKIKNIDANENQKQSKNNDNMDKEDKDEDAFEQLGNGNTLTKNIFKDYDEGEETQDIDETDKKVNKDNDNDLQSEDIRQLIKEKWSGKQKSLFYAQAEQSPMLRNSLTLNKRVDLLFSSCQQSLMKSEVLRFDQKIVKELWNCSQQIAEVYFQIEDIEFSLNYYNKCIEFADKLFGKRSLQVAQIYENIGLVRLENMDFDESQEAFLKSVSIKQRVCCEDHPQLGFCFSYLGCLYAKFHMYRQAKEYYLKALTIFQLKYKQHRKELSETYNNIANIHLNEADIGLAISSYEKALNLFIQIEQEIPPLHFAQIYENLGIAYYRCALYEKSQSFFQDAINVLVTLYDQGHPSLLRVRNWLKSVTDHVDASNQTFYIS